jgi:two-component system, OmpR family, sensor histidine kinase ChvG
VFERLRRKLGRLHVRLLIVNAMVLLVPVAGLEFARLFEHELLSSLERDMRNQATLVRHFLEVQGPAAFDEKNEQVLARSASDTRTRVRVLDALAAVRLDSHRLGPPEGEEAPAPRSLPETLSPERRPQQRWSDLADRREIKDALAGKRSAFTRIREREPSVFLFVSEPIRQQAQVVGVVYITRSTRPVMAELYRIRASLQKMLLLALVFTIGITLWLAYSITGPLERLSRVATRIAAGETDLQIPVSGSGELRELGTALQVMTSRLQQRMQDTAQFAADVAHGFKSPLTSIRGAAELLAQGAAFDPKARERFLNNIELDSERLDRLVTRLLQLSRIEASTTASSENELATLLEEAAQRSATPDVAIVVRALPEPALLHGRREDLVTAFANLFDNAVRFSPAGGTVYAELLATESHYQVRVCDSGAGVPEEAEARLFQRFFSTDVDHGTGLGLAIVKSVAEAHGGRAYYSRPAGAQGACFVVELRRAPRAGA